MTAPSKAALTEHERACERGDPGYFDPDSRLFVMTSLHLRERGECCGSGCRHCPYDAVEQQLAGRPDVPSWPYP